MTTETDNETTTPRSAQRTLDGVTIVITGASDGIGAAAARKLHALGEQVVVVGRSPERTAAVAAELGAPHFVADFDRPNITYRIVPKDNPRRQLLAFLRAEQGGSTVGGRA